MKIISFIEDSKVIEKILRHCELWKVPAPHPPPVKSIGSSEKERGPFLDYQFTSASSVHALRRSSVQASTRTAFEYFTSFFQLEHKATRLVYSFLSFEQKKHILLMCVVQDKDGESGKKGES